MKNKLHYLLICVFYFAFITANAQQKENENMIKLKEALLDLDANGNVKDTLKVQKYYELLKKHLINGGRIGTEENTETASQENSNSIKNSENEEMTSEDSLQRQVVPLVPSSDCDSNVKKAIYRLKVSNGNQSDSLKILEYIKPCLELGNSKAQLLMARLYVKSGTEENNKKAFKLLKESAKQKNVSAMADLGVMFKYGLGCKLNYNKARKRFEKAAELGNDKASYSLGYLYLKGFGNIEQDYSKAIKWFNKSKHSMAKYWLGMCYKKGYGVEKDIQKANELLNTNFSESEVTDLNNNNLSQEVEEQILTNEDSLEENNESTDVNENDLLGKWNGSLLKFDWSENYIEDKAIFSLEILKDSISGALSSTITIGDYATTNDILKLDNSIYFNETKISLPHESYLDEIPTSLEYEILSSDLSLKNHEGLTYLTGKIESYIEKWSEAGAPLCFVLKKQEIFKNSDKELSEEILKALSEQENNFIKLYPNPFENDLIIAYELIEAATVKVQINDLYGSLISVVKKAEQQKKGKYQYLFDANKLKSGTYIVSVFVNNERKTKITIKK